MPTDELSPEDRDRLVRVKFGELATEWANSDDGRKWLDGYVNGLAEFTKNDPPQQQHQSTPQTRHRRRSLLDMSFEQILGIR